MGCAAAGPLSPVIPEICSSMCTNNGRYCAINNPDEDADDPTAAVALGAELVAEAWRRTCIWNLIWNLYGVEDGRGEPWWKYVKEFTETSGSPERPPEFYANKECIQSTMKAAGVNRAKVDKCMSEAGGLEADAENKVLAQTLRDAEKQGAIYFPTLYVNNGPIRGELIFAVASRQDQNRTSAKRACTATMPRAVSRTAANAAAGVQFPLTVASPCLHSS